MMQVEDRRSGRVFLMSVAVRDCENISLFSVSSVTVKVVRCFTSFHQLRLALRISIITSSVAFR